MNFAVCPDDGTHLKAVHPRPDPGQSLLLACPHCGKRFRLTDGGIRELPPDDLAT